MMFVIKNYKPRNFRCRDLLKKMKVEVVCTTDDPADSLEFHQSYRKQGLQMKLLPTFRPDRAMTITDPAAFISYLKKLGESANISIENFSQLMEALRSRHDFFHAQGCRVSDHGLEQLYETGWTEKDLKTIFVKAFSGKIIGQEEMQQFQSGVLFLLAEWDHEKKWVQQFHLGAMRNNNTSYACNARSGYRLGLYR